MSDAGYYRPFNGPETCYGALPPGEATIFDYACGTPFPGFAGEVPPSAFHGFWQLPDAGRPLGIVIYELPGGGTGWSPHGLFLESARVYVTHDCRDFKVNPVTGLVTPAIGIHPAGTVSSTSADTAKLAWDLEAGWFAELQTAFAMTPKDGGVYWSGPSLDAGVTRKGAALEFELELQWVEQSSDGGASRVTAREVQLMTLTRALTCP